MVNMINIMIDMAGRLSAIQSLIAMPEQALKIDGGKLAALQQKTGEAAETGDNDREGRAIRCANCGHRITRTNHRITINGSHQHVFNNPSGYIFEIGCFSAAEGCAVQGMPTFEFTWFTGHRWQFAVCAKCLSHLGWVYTPSGQSAHGGFFGLILTHLVEE